jgi:mono/diheme cytochrome c family protein
MQRRAPAVFVLFLLCLGGCAGDSAAQRSATVPARAMADPARGQLLYQTACATCHTEQAHWRDKSMVRDWPGLIHQVARWQKVAGQTWRPEEIEDVAAYLNRRFYQLSCPLPGCAADKVGLR